MISLPPWPLAADPMWSRAAQVYNALWAKCPENPFVIAALANGYMESRFETWVVGDQGHAFNIWQWWWEPRGAAIFAATGIDVRSERSIAKVCEALWWELNSYPYAASLAAIPRLQNCECSCTLVFAKDRRRRGNRRG